MPYLDTLLAYAVTMLAVATVVTQLVRLIQKLLSVRQDQFGKLLHDFYGQDLKPVMEREMKRVRSIAAASAATLPADSDIAASLTALMSRIQSRTTDISTEALLTEIRRTTVGTEISAELKAEVDEIMGELGRRWEQIGKIYTERFRRKSQCSSTVVAIILAFVLNIDTVHIVTEYYTDTAARAVALASLEDVVARYEKIPPGDAADSITYRQLRKEIDEVRTGVQSLATAPAPIGWLVFPYSGFGAVADTGGWALAWQLFVWLVGILATGFLAGLGAPFWYDVVLGIRKATEQARGGR
ncbi:MAG: hypothetical protein HY962_08290 [Ignavibacteriae bacterium]|nr:hypothetical protein [Ignavibacteriota bacterium]